MPRSRFRIPRRTPGIQNKSELSGVNKTAGCFKCLTTYNTSSIKEWADFGMTAVCPLCSSLSVVAKTANENALTFQERLKAHRKEMLCDTT